MIALLVDTMCEPRHRRLSPEFDPELCGGGGLETGKFKRVRAGEKTTGNSAVVWKSVRVFSAVVI